MKPLSPEATIAIIGVILSLLPTILVLVRYLRRRRTLPRWAYGGTYGLSPSEAVAHSNNNNGPHTYQSQLGTSGHGYFYTNSHPVPSYIEEQYSLSKTITLRRANP